MSRPALILTRATLLALLVGTSTASAGTSSWTGAELYADWNETSFDTSYGTRQYSVEGDDLRILSQPVNSCNGSRCGTDRTFSIPVTCTGDDLSITVFYTPVRASNNSTDNDLLVGIGDEDQVLFNAYGDTGSAIQYFYYSSYNQLASYNQFVVDSSWRTAFDGTPITAVFAVDRSAGTSWQVTSSLYQGTSSSILTSTAGSQYLPDGDLQFELITGDRFEEYLIHTVSLSGCEAGTGTSDADGDGIDDSVDNCPSDANADQADLDEDGLGDVCDSDADGDGDDTSVDCDDLDPSRYTAAIEICDDLIDNDCDGNVDLDDVDVVLDAPDSDCDGDGVLYTDDNCAYDFNPGQADLDADADGDVCDPDDDGDGFDDDVDNCPTDANASQTDTDGDGDGDACDDDSDGDGVLNENDYCDGTIADAPTKGLGQNRWADVDGDGEFDTKGKNPTGRYFTIEDALGCSCEQIIDECGYGSGHSKHGCSNSVMDTWTGLYDEVGGAPGTCKAE